jgi:phospholipid/cholesterol/gamma-HCH transport system substrate-binding protein
MKKQTNRALRVGFFVFCGLIIFIVTLYLIGSKDNLFESKTNIITSFKDVRGVVVGNNVRYSGINVGKVKSITITPDGKVMLELAIVREYAKFIHTNATVEINQDGLLGAKLLDIKPGKGDADKVKDGDYLNGKEGIDMENLMFDLRNILSEANLAVGNIESVTEKINRGEGDIGKLINEDRLTSKLDLTVQKLNESLNNINLIVEKVNNGDGDVGRLINDKALTTEANKVLDNLNQSTEIVKQIASNLEKTTNTINEGKGTVGMLLNNESTAQNLDTTILKVQSSLIQFEKTAKAIENSWILNLFSKKKKDK